MDKHCSKCQKRKYLVSFYRRKSGPRAGEYYEKCKDCMKFRGRNYYHQNHERQLRLAKKRTRKARMLKKDFIDKIKNIPCMDCNNKFPACAMDFDHRNRTQKVAAIATMIVRNWSLEKISKEIEKCDIVCSNCHRIRHYEKHAEIA